MIEAMRILGATDVKYKIICAGAEFDIGLNKPVKVEYYGRTYQAKMHSKTKGRIDGLGQLFADGDFSVGQELHLYYEENSNTIRIDVCPSELLRVDQEPHGTVGFPAFNGEYYIDKDFWNLSAGGAGIAAYGNMCYFTKGNDVMSCEDGKFGEKRALIWDPMSYEDSANAVFYRGTMRLFVNAEGIFVYHNFGSLQDIPACRLFTHEGKPKGTFKLRQGDGDIVDAYIVDDTFYCVSNKEFFSYRFDTGEEYRSKFTLPAGQAVERMCVANEHVYLKLRPKEQWYMLRTEPNVPLTGSRINPIFGNAGNIEISFLHPQQNIAWTRVHESQGWTYKAYNLSDGKYAGRKFTIPQEDSNIIYFDGKYMLTTSSGSHTVSSLNIATGEKRSFNNIWKTNTFLVMQERLYMVAYDEISGKKFLVSVPLHSTQGEEIKLCGI